MNGWKMLALLVLCCVACQAYAGLGWTEGRFEGAYGAPTDRSMTTGKDGRPVQVAPKTPAAGVQYERHYRHKGMRISATFVNDRCLRVGYWKPSGMSADEWDKLVGKILAATLGRASAWLPRGSGFRRDDGSAVASVAEGALTLIDAVLIPRARGGTAPDTTPKADDFKF